MKPSRWLGVGYLGLGLLGGTMNHAGILALAGIMCLASMAVAWREQDREREQAARRRVKVAEATYRRRRLQATAIEVNEVKQLT